MKALLVLYSELMERCEDKLYSKLEKNINLLQKLIGIDSLYASVSSRFKDMFDFFPELCFINSINDSAVFAAYRGLRKLRGNDVLLVDCGVELTKESVVSFLNRIHVTVGVMRNRWAGIALIKMRDLDYVVRSFERNFQNGIIDAFYTLRDTYSIVTEFIDLGEKVKPLF